MDKNIIEDMRCMYQIDAWETYGKDAVAVMNEGFLVNMMKIPP